MLSICWDADKEGNDDDGDDDERRRSLVFRGTWENYPFKYILFLTLSHFSSISECKQEGLVLCGHLVNLPW